jgi:hypothetical protein
MRPVLLDEEDGRAGDVPRVDAQAMPHAVGARHSRRSSIRDVEGQAGLLRS